VDEARQHVRQSGMRVAAILARAAADAPVQPVCVDLAGLGRTAPIEAPVQAPGAPADDGRTFDDVGRIDALRLLSTKRR